jgi:hypothetical protein
MAEIAVRIDASRAFKMMTVLLHAVNALFCQHEWITRAQPQRLYLECVKCLAVSPGIDTRRDATTSAPTQLPNVPERGLSATRQAA